LHLAPESTLPIDDVISLRKEVDEIWDKFAVDTEHAGYTQAVISATGPEDGGLISLYFIVLRKGPLGDRTQAI
jgi:hypothetical protein